MRDVPSYCLLACVWSVITTDGYATVPCSCRWTSAVHCQLPTQLQLLSQACISACVLLVMKHTGPFKYPPAKASISMLGCDYRVHSDMVSRECSRQWQGDSFKPDSKQAWCTSAATAMYSMLKVRVAWHYAAVGSCLHLSFSSLSTRPGVVRTGFSSKHSIGTYRQLLSIL